MSTDELYYSSTATSLPALHFPAFAAADRVGGGFRRVQMCLAPDFSFQVGMLRIHSAGCTVPAVVACSC
jgi:hypothetical protein